MQVLMAHRIHISLRPKRLHLRRLRLRLRLRPRHRDLPIQTLPRVFLTTLYGVKIILTTSTNIDCLSV